MEYEHGHLASLAPSPFTPKLVSVIVTQELAGLPWSLYSGSAHIRDLPSLPRGSSNAYNSTWKSEPLEVEIHVRS